ncbi:MAG: RNase adaptor protein RapZ, partial [Alphaproteobacteria bacterium]|nr:RNase adaptor protein RapZ [Alphaproteobacteria bacterium]
MTRRPITRRPSPRPVVLVTGISGAGKSSALKALEDLGFETVDNVPLGFLAGLAAQASKSAPLRPLAVGIDVRTRDFDSRALLAQARALARTTAGKATLVFMDAADEVLQRRYAETRHRHPLAGSGPLLDGIRRERKLLRAARARADLVVDTSEFGPGELKHVLAGRFGAGRGAGMAVFVTSFAYRKGL